LYRGVNYIDESILNQVPYAMRRKGLCQKPEILWHIRAEVETLARNPIADEPSR
jgi:hypothetical protein